MAHYSLYLILLLSIYLNRRWLLFQSITLEIPEKADMENWMYSLQGRAVGEIQPIGSWSHSLQHLEGSHIPILELPWKLQPKVLGVQENLLAHGILYIPVVSVFMALLSLLGMQQAFVHQLLDLLHLLDLVNTSYTALNPIQHIQRHPNLSPIYYVCWM